MLTLDSHLDTLHEFARLNLEDYDLDKDRPNLAVDLPRLRRGGVNALFLALFVKQEWGLDQGRQRVERLMGILGRLLTENGWLSLSRSADQIESAVARGQVSVSLGIENGVVLGEDLSYVERYHQIGVRYLTLCHNQSNAICDSSTDAARHDGLSAFGKQLIAEMNRVGMMIDVSHASDRATEQALDLSARPLIASHSNARSICDNPRNLSDDLIISIAAKGGVIQVSALPKCVEGDSTVSAMIDHIDHIVQLVGPSHVGIGSDFDGGGRVRGFADVGDAGAITRQLKARAYSAADIAGIWGLNLLRVLRANEG